MTANPFFSGRIPQELFDQAVDHSKTTGQSKTEILVRALSQYLDMPVPAGIQSNAALEARITLIEQRLEAISVISTDNTDKEKENGQLSIFDNTDNRSKKPEQNKLSQSLGQMIIGEVMKLPKLEGWDKNKLRNKLKSIHRSKNREVEIEPYLIKAVGQQSGLRKKVIYEVYENT
jgi:hypothetical protein